jgi:very-short-patch-repair endonuclease
VKPLRFPTKKEESDYMRMRQDQNLARARSLKSENWFFEGYLASLPTERRFKFTRQASWGYRLFDFWFHDRGAAVEIDGPEHNAARDAYRDKYNFLRSGIIVLRVRNFNDDDAVRAVENLQRECAWQERRAAMGLLTAASSRRGRRELSENGDWQEALRRISDAGLFCSYGKPSGPSKQPRLF